MTQPALSDPLASLREFVEARLGLRFPPERQSDLERGVKATAAELGFGDPRECALWLLSPGATARGLEALAGNLTIGETYFFRDPKAFQALETIVLPDLISGSATPPKRLRIWSAGCCTGEEPYSIAISVVRALRRRDECRVSILATDLNTRFLRKAEAGIYKAWSFRGMPDALKARHFTEREPGEFELDPAIRGLVKFTHLNLVEDAYPAVLNDTHAMDVIFCRNVLMYFAPETAQRVLEKLHAALTPNGWLVTSATDTSPQMLALFTRAEIEGVSIYRKRERHAASEPPPLAFTLESGPELPAAVLESATPPEDLAEQTRVLADRGQFAEALEACDRALEIDKTRPADHYLRAMILQEQGALEEAARSLKRALFLDGDFVLAHWALGNLRQRQGRMEEAARSHQIARDLLRGQDAGAVLPESGGMAAGHLLALLSNEKKERP